MCVHTRPGDSMDVSKLALPLLVPNLRQLGHVHLCRLEQTELKNIHIH